MIPSRLKIVGIRFVLVEKGGKRPFQQGWQNKNISYDDPELVTHIQNGGNYGVMGGGESNLLIVDFDNEKVQEEILRKLPPTFTVRTGSGMMHKYFFSDKVDSFKIFDEEMNTLVDVQGEGKQCIAPGSIHPNGNPYSVLEDNDIAFIPYDELRAIIIPYDRKPRREKKLVVFDKPKEYSQDSFLDDLKMKIKMPELLSMAGVDISRNPTNCPFHDSKGGKCLGFNDETAHCFHCEGAWNIFSFAMEYTKSDFKKSLEFLAEKANMTKELEESRKKYIQSLKKEETDIYKKLKAEFISLAKVRNPNIPEATELLVRYILDNNSIYTVKNDKMNEMWIYRDGVYVSEGKSEVRIILRNILEEFYDKFYSGAVLAKIESSTAIDAIDFFRVTHKNEIAIENGILNIITRELTSFTPEKIFFNKLPVSYNPDAKCPAIDSFLDDVLANKEDKKVFYELAGYILLNEYLFEKAFIMVGDGRNGKDKTLELLKRFVGVHNCASVPLVALDLNNFTISELFGKRINLAGEISNSDLKDTTAFKALTGRSLISAHRKFLSDIVFVNNAKFVYACNDLPMVYDTSRGFWDRWILLQFPYTFLPQDEMEMAQDKTFLKLRDEDIINKIVTPEELSGLLNAALDGLMRLLGNKTFSTTIGSQEIKDMWVRKANSFAAFCMDFIQEDVESHITKKELRKIYSAYCKVHKVRTKSDLVVKRVLQEEFGASEDRLVLGTFPDSSLTHVWVGIKWKNQDSISKISKLFRAAGGIDGFFK